MPAAVPSEALTSPALLSQRERREKNRNTDLFSCSPLSLWERGARGVRASEGTPLHLAEGRGGEGFGGKAPEEGP
jgi:hypothetical protein